MHGCPLDGTKSCAVKALHSTALSLGVTAMRCRDYRQNVRSRSQPIRVDHRARLSGRRATVRRGLDTRALGPFDSGLGFGFALPAWSMGFGAMLPELRDEVAMSSSVAAIHGSLFGIFLLLFSVVGSRFFATRRID